MVRRLAISAWSSWGYWWLDDGWHWCLDDGWQHSTVACLCQRGTFLHLVAYTWQT